MNENDISRLETQLLQMRDMLTRQDEKLSHVTNKDLDITPLVNRLNAIEKKLMW